MFASMIDRDSLDASRIERIFSVPRNYG